MVNENQANVYGIFDQILTNRKKFWSFFGFVLMILFLSALTSYLLSEYIFSKATEVRFNSSGAVEIIVDKRLAKASFLLSANGNGAHSPWINTGIKINEGEMVKYFASGNMCSAAHHMIDAALKNTTLPPQPWTDKFGMDKDRGLLSDKINYNDPKAPKRKKYLVVNGLPQGRLMGIIVPEGQIPVSHLSKDSVIDIPTQLNFSSISKGGILWLTVNEVWLNSDLLETLTKDDLLLSQKEFDLIKTYDYANVWYDDNIGYFSVSIEIKGK